MKPTKQTPMKVPVMSNVPASIERIDGGKDSIAEQDLRAMKEMICAVKVKPLLLYQFFSLPANVLSETVLHFMTGPKVGRRSSIKSSRSEPELNDLCSGMKENVCEYEDKDEGKVTERDILDMKVMIQNIRVNPSSYYEKFDLPWTDKELEDDANESWADGS